MKTYTKIAKLSLAAASVALSLSIANAQYVDLLTFGTTSSGGVPAFGAAAPADTGWTSQNATSILVTTGFALGNTFYNDSPLSLSLPGNQSLFLKTTVTTNPNAPFTIYNSDDGDFANNNFSGSTNDPSNVLAGGFTYIPLAKNGSPTLAFGFMNFAWGGDSSTTPNMAINAISVVPEPSTYALMALGGLVLFFVVRRHKAQQV